MVKVQDGCSHSCTYCIVPLTRGPSCSREPTETLAELRRLLAAGFRELTVSGINLAQYGRDLAKPHDFWDLMETVNHSYEVDNNEYINIIDELIDLGNATVGDFYITLDNQNADNLELLNEAKKELLKC